MQAPPLDAVLEKLSAQLGPLDGAPVPLDGGLSGRTFRVHLGRGDYVVHLGGKDTKALGISRAAEREATETAARMGVGPEVAAYLPAEDVLVTRYLEGRPLRPEEVSEPDILADLAESLKTLHRGRRLRVPLAPFRVVEVYRTTAEAHGTAVDERYDLAHALADRIEAAMTGTDHTPVPIHGDLMPSNFIYHDERVCIVDWEYAGMGDPFFDLGNFSVNNDLSADEDAALLEAYDGERPRRERLARLALMRVVSDFREAMWGVLQQGVSTLDVDFRAYADEHFERLLHNSATARFERALRDVAGD